VDKAPPHRTEDELPKEQRQSDGEEDARNDRSADGDPAEGRDPLDLVEDVTDLGLGEVDVGSDEPLRCILGRADLVAKARGVLVGTGGRRGRWDPTGLAAAGVAGARLVGAARGLARVALGRCRRFGRWRRSGLEVR
jgi:hypothetical protein